MGRWFSYFLHRKECIIIASTELKTSVTYEATGEQTVFNIPFDYLRNSFVKAKIGDDGEPMEYGTDYEVANRQITFTTAPVGMLYVYRETSTDRMVQFMEGSVLKAADMNLSTLQQLHIIEEGQDWTRESSILLDEEDNAWEARNAPIKNVGDPVNPQDAVTKKYIEDVKTGFISVMTQTKDSCIAALNSTKESCISTLNSIKDSCISTINSTKDAAVAAITELKETFSTFVSNKTDEVTTLKNQAETAAANADKSAELAQKWAESANSPDGEADSKSSKTWAAEAAQSADEALQAAESVGDPYTSISEENGIHKFVKGSGTTTTLETIAKDREGNLIDKTYTKISPDYFYREKIFTSTSGGITIHAGLRVVINDNLYINNADVTLETVSAGDANSRAGQDVYIYACVPESGTSPTFVLSRNSTVPTDYTAENSRKIGGFHCLGVNVGTITGHTLSGYTKGSILPQTIWDLIHRPSCDSPEGMFYVPESDTWMDIYGLSWDGSKLVSVYGGTWADGTSAKKWHGEATLEQLMKQGKRLPWRHEFQMAAKGSNEQTNIQGSNDPSTTGGHLDTAGRRMISNYGGEDMCGVMWQWTMDLGFAGGSGWTDAVYSSTVDDRSYGQSYGNLYRLLVGGRWANGASCGSRCALCNRVSSYVRAYGGARGASEPLFRNALKRKTA